MKLLPEEPTQEMGDAYEEAGNIMFSLAGYKALYATAPEVNDGPVAVVVNNNLPVIYPYLGDNIDFTAKLENRRKTLAVGTKLYAHPSPRIAELEAEVARLKEKIVRLENSNRYLQEQLQS